MQILEAMTLNEFVITVIAVFLGVGLYELFQLMLAYVFTQVERAINFVREWRREMGPVWRSVLQWFKPAVPQVGGWTPDVDELAAEPVLEDRPDPSYWPYVINERTRAVHRRDCNHVSGEHYITWYWAQTARDAVEYVAQQGLNVCASCLPKVKREAGA